MEEEVAEGTCIGCGEEWARSSSSIGWISPRISFSDFVRLDDGVSLETPTRDIDGFGESGYCSSTDEFEFGIAESVLNNLMRNETVLTADEVVHSGKMRSLGSECNLLRFAESYEDDQDGPCTNIRQLLSDEVTRCYSSMDFENPRVKTLPTCVGNGNCGSTSFSLRSTAPTKASKYSQRLLSFFKPRKLHLQTASKELPSLTIAREHSVSSNCNLPISAMIISPSPRNSSSGEGRKIKYLPLFAGTKGNNSITESRTSRRSNSASAVENRTTCTSASSNSAIQTSSCSRPQGTQWKACPVPAKRDSSTCSLPNLDANVCNKFRSPADSSFQIIPHGTARLSRASSSVSSVTSSPYSTLTAPALICLQRHDNETVDITIDIKESVKQADDVKDMNRNAPVRMASAKLQEYGNTGRVQRTDLSSPSRTFAGGRPGRRLSSCSSPCPVRGTSGKTVPNSLERGSAGLDVPGRSRDLRKSGVWTGSNGLSSYSDSVKEATVLNVSVCTFPSITGGKFSKNRFRSCGTLLSKKPSKPPPPSISGG